MVKKVVINPDLLVEKETAANRRNERHRHRELSRRGTG